MAEPVYLLLRAEPTRWAKAIHYTGVFLLGSFGIAAFWTRVISENASREANSGLLETLYSVLWVTGIAAVCWLMIGAVTYLLEGAQLINVKQQQPLGTIKLSEDLLLLGDQSIAVCDLKSIVVTSDQYAGAPQGRSRSSGAGKIVADYKGVEQEITFLVIIQSACELKKLRELSACWRSQQVTAFIMD